jgi:hypothetical protein
VYDNLNVHQKIRQGRQIVLYKYNYTIQSINPLTHIHQQMLNTTTRSAVSIWNLPPWEFSWTDTSPQKAWHELSVDDIIPGPQDGQQFFDRAVVYTMRLLVEVFPCLAGLAKFLPTMDVASPILKSTVIPHPGSAA